MGLAPTETDLEALICSHPWPCDQALAVVFGPTPPNAAAPAGCGTGESNGQPRARNGGNIGLMQIHLDSHYDKLVAVVGWRPPYAEAVELLFNPAINIDVGYLVWEANGGFGAWSCRP